MSQRGHSLLRHGQVALGPATPRSLRFSRRRLQQTLVLETVQRDVDGPTRDLPSQTFFELLEDEGRVGGLTDLEDSEQHHLFE